MVGRKYGALTVIRFAGTGNNGARWLCKCDCGKEKTVDGYLLRRGSIKTCGCGIGLKNDFIGKRFGKLLIVGKAGKSSDRCQKWKAICDCGNIIEISSRSLLSGKTQSCGCARREEKGKAAFNKLYRNYQSSAKQRELEFNLSESDFEKLVTSPCHYCGSNPSQISHRKYGNGDFVYNGIDRIDNTQGYILGNVVSCCFICNRAKGQMEENEFNGWIQKLITYQCGK